MFVQERTNNCCEYCFSQVGFSPDPFVIKHIIPKIKNGTDELDNLAFSCSSCNGHKYDYTDGYDAVIGELAPLDDLRQQLWASHFVWSTDFTEIIGTSPIGRATIAFT